MCQDKREITGTGVEPKQLQVLITMSYEERKGVQIKKQKHTTYTRNLRSHFCVN